MDNLKGLTDKERREALDFVNPAAAVPAVPDWGDQFALSEATLSARHDIVNPSKDDPHLLAPTEKVDKFQLIPREELDRFAFPFTRIKYRDPLEAWPDIHVEFPDEAWKDAMKRLVFDDEYPDFETTMQRLSETLAANKGTNDTTHIQGSLRPDEDDQPIFPAPRTTPATVWEAPVPYEIQAPDLTTEVSASWGIDVASAGHNADQQAPLDLGLDLAHTDVATEDPLTTSAIFTSKFGILKTQPPKWLTNLNELPV